ncbi:MAG: SH3 domain-containing protein [Micavibrio sp.]
MSSNSILKSILFLIAVVCALFFIQGVRAEDVPPELKGSGLPLPRYVSISTDKAYVRSGPAPRYPVKWIYKKDGFPVEIVQEFDVWRKIRDIDGDEGWINKALLSDKRSIIIKADEAIDMREGFTRDARIMARLEPGVIASLQKCNGDWCQISAGGFSGWVERNFLWGIYAKEEIN